MELFKLLFKLSSQTEKKFGKLNARFSGLTKKSRGGGGGDKRK